MSFIQTIFVIIFVVSLYVFNAMHKSLIGTHVKFEKDYNVYEGTIVSEMLIKKMTMNDNKMVVNKYKLFEVDVGQEEPIVMKKEKLIIINDYWKK
jgi:hypothetical protein